MNVTETVHFTDDDDEPIAGWCAECGDPFPLTPGAPCDCMTTPEPLPHCEDV